MEVFKKIVNMGVMFILCGDDFGIYKKELGIWVQVNIEFNFGGYCFVG